MAGDKGTPRDAGTLSNATTRKVGILLDLIRHRRISLSGCVDTYGTSDRTILRDLQEFRVLGQTAGFRISQRRDGDYFELTEFRGRPNGLAAGDARVRGLIAVLFKAFGEPMHDAAEILGDPTGPAPFIRVVAPQLADGTTVAKVCRDLEAAWSSGARVEFRYRDVLRIVEPAAAIVRSGRYYLVGRDIAKGKTGWRMFAMDLIEPPLRRCGSFVASTPPARYLSSDSIGFFKNGGRSTEVAVTFSKTLAAAAVSRKWQEAQRVRRNPDGTATISLFVEDVDEVVRWALGFGDEAWISAPPAAIVRARGTLAKALEHYD